MEIEHRYRQMLQGKKFLYMGSTILGSQKSATVYTLCELEDGRVKITWVDDTDFNCTYKLTSVLENIVSGIWGIIPDDE